MYYKFIGFKNRAIKSLLVSFFGIIGGSSLSFAISTTSNTASASTMQANSTSTHSTVESPSPTRFTETQLELYVPYEGSELVKSLTIQQRLKGTCTTSLIDKRKGAWRCMAGGNVYDPCFMSPKAGIFACTQTPWNKSITLVTAQDYPKTSFKTFSLATTEPWGLELVDHRCILITESNGLLHGLPMKYKCGHDNYILGEIDKTYKIWQVKLSNLNNPKIKRLQVITAWY